MSVSYIHYELKNGFIDHWLVAGPQVIADIEPCHYLDSGLKAQIASKHRMPDSGIHELPVERGPLTEGNFRVGDYQGSWSYYRCLEDHFIDHSGYHVAPVFLRSWAYAQLTAKRACQVTLELTTLGPADMWLGEQRIYRQEQFSDHSLLTVPIQTKLRKGWNALLICFEGVAFREYAHKAALRVVGNEARDEIGVRIPTLISPQLLDRRRALEEIYTSASVDRDLYAWEDAIALLIADELSEEVPMTVRLQTPSGSIYAQAQIDGQAGDRLFLSRAGGLEAGPYHIFMMPRISEYYEKDLRFTHTKQIWNLGALQPSEAPYGDLEERRGEALAGAIKRKGSLFAEIAKMALGRWQLVDPEVILKAIGAVDRCWADSEVLLVSLLGMMIRFGGVEQFPQNLRAPLESCILGFHYGSDDPRQDRLDFLPGDSSILFHTAEILAGQLFPEHRFTISGQIGQWHRQRGQKLALEWLRTRALTGAATWGSDVCVSNHLVALSHLIDLVEDDAIFEMASVVMDKLLFTLAVTSYKGTLGAPSTQASALSVQSGMAQAISGVTRLLWGCGTYNEKLASTVSLACMQQYELPSILAEVASLLPEVDWGRQRHISTSAGSPSATEVNVVSFRTPDYLLSSFQDYQAGKPGSRVHPWQATLGASAIVFTNHPGSMQVAGGDYPNFWVGNGVLPRLAQWQDVLVAIYQLPEDTWLKFTHAYFPAFAFDEFILRQGWAFARKGEGYLALTAANGLHLSRREPGAYRELRSDGLENIWICHMGRAAMDGSFADFQHRVLGLKVNFQRLQVSLETCRGDQLFFGWEGPFLRNGEAQPLAGFRHYENLYTMTEMNAYQMLIERNGAILRLNFAEE